MKKHFAIALLAIILLPLFSNAQRWKRFRKQFIVGVGVTNFLGELGGSDKIGRDFIYDLDFAATRPSLLVGYRYQFNNYLFGRANLQWGVLKGSDEFTENKYREGRNLNFTSGYFEGDFMAEFYLLQNARGNLYRLRGVRGRSGLKLDLYIYAGLGFMWFNPKTDYKGSKIALQPLGTEGQGLPGQPDKYRRTTFTVPYGIGIGKSLDRYWAVNIEFTMRQAFSDYLDDVSGNYYGRAELERDLIANGVSASQAQVTAELSDRNIYGELYPELGIDPGQQMEVGGQRGDPEDNDSFMTGMITISRKIVKRRRSRPKF